MEYYPRCTGMQRGVQNWTQMLKMFKEMLKNVSTFFKKIQKWLSSITVFDFTVKMHSDKYKHAEYLFSNPWNTGFLIDILELLEIKPHISVTTMWIWHGENTHFFWVVLHNLTQLVTPGNQMTITNSKVGWLQVTVNVLLLYAIKACQIYSEHRLVTRTWRTTSLTETS